MCMYLRMYVCMCARVRVRVWYRGQVNLVIRALGRRRLLQQIFDLFAFLEGAEQGPGKGFPSSSSAGASGASGGPSSSPIRPTGPKLPPRLRPDEESFEFLTNALVASGD